MKDIVEQVAVSMDNNNDETIYVVTAEGRLLMGVWSGGKLDWKDITPDYMR